MSVSITHFGEPVALATGGFCILSSHFGEPVASATGGFRIWSSHLVFASGLRIWSSHLVFWLLPWKYLRWLTPPARLNAKTKCKFHEIRC